MSDLLSSEGIPQQASLSHASAEGLELAGLRAVADAVRLGLSVEGVVEHCLDRILDALGVDFGCIYVRRHDYLIRLAARGTTSPDAGSGPALPIPSAVVDLTEAPWAARPFVAFQTTDGGSKAWMALPLAIGEQLIGVLAVGAWDRASDQFPTLDMAQRVSGPVALAIDNAERLAGVRGLLEDTRDIIFRADANGCWTYLNSAWQELLGEPVALALGQRITNYLMPAHDARRPVGLALLVAPGSEEGRQTLPFVRRDGELCWMDVEARLVRDDRGTVIGAAGVLRDVTEQVRQAAELQRHATELERANEQLERADELKSQLLRSVSHELNTPLAVMLGYAEMLADGVPDEVTPGQQELLGYIQEGGRRLKRRIDDLMLLARLQAGTLKLDVETVDVWETCTLLLERYREAADEAGVTLERPPLRTLSVQADRIRLETALSALLDNAIKFSRRGGQVEFELSLVEAPALVRLAIVDHGDGIAPERLGRLFEMFVQADGSQTRRHDGLGLGLAISRGLLELMGGSLVLTSDGQGQGACAEVLLPAALLPVVCEQPAAPTT